MSGQGNRKNNEEEGFMTFNEPEQVKESSWLKKAVGSGAHVIAEITGIHLIKNNPSLSQPEDEEDNYSPFDNEESIASKYIPTYGVEDHDTLKKPQGMQFDDRIEKGYTDFNNVAQDIYSQAQHNYAPRAKKRRKQSTESSTFSTIFKLALIATIGFLGWAGYKRALSWAQTSPTKTAKIIRERFDIKPADKIILPSNTKNSRKSR